MIGTLPKLSVRRICLLVVAATIALTGTTASLADDQQIVPLCRQYLSAEGDARRELETRIREYDGPVEPVLEALAETETTDWQKTTGVLTSQHFESPELKASFPDDLLHFFIPEKYTPAQPVGLLIFMHGGGRTTPRDDPRHVVSTPDDDPASYGFQPYFKDSKFIIAAPSAPWNEKTGSRWNIPEADAYLKAVIRECRYRFNIDADRVFLGGYSMGGFGAFHLGQRLNDQLAGVVIFSGAWKTTDWSAWNGLPMFLRHGRHDAVPAGTEGKKPRPRYTDVFYAQAADRKLRELGTDHLYIEDDFGHAIQEAADAVSQLPGWMEKHERNRFPHHVVAVSPCGWNASRDTPSPDCHWLTIRETGDATIAFDTVARDGPAPAWNETREAFEAQSFRIVPKQFNAGSVDAKLTGKNRFVVETKNVKEFSIWLHPEMIDFSQPVRVSVNGKETVHQVQPSLLPALHSYPHRQDWRLVGRAEIVISVQL